MTQMTWVLSQKWMCKGSKLWQTSSAPYIQIKRVYNRHPENIEDILADLIRHQHKAVQVWSYYRIVVRASSDTPYHTAPLRTFSFSSSASKRIFKLEIYRKGAFQNDITRLVQYRFQNSSLFNSQFLPSSEQQTS